MQLNETKFKLISLGKIDLNDVGRRLYPAYVKLTLRPTGNGPELSAVADVWNPFETDIVMGGQCFDELSKHIKNNLEFDFVYDMWQKYHLNGMHAGTKEQETALKEAVEKGVLKTYGANNFKETCDYLKSIHLYEVEVDGQPYQYGSGWLFEEIPETDLQRINDFIDGIDIFADSYSINNDEIDLE